MLVLVGLMTYTTLVFLLQGSAATGAATYSQLTRVMCGPVVMKVTGCLWADVCVAGICLSASTCTCVA